MAVWKIDLKFKHPVHAMIVEERGVYFFEGNKADVDHMIDLLKPKLWSGTITRVDIHQPETIIERFQARLES